MLVMGETSKSMCCFSKCVRTGSRQQDFAGALSTKSVMNFLETGANSLNTLEHGVDIKETASTDVESTELDKLSRSFFIFSLKCHIGQSDCERLVHAFITSKLDMCNSILIGLPSTELDRLQ